jgi:hypothetical protein
VAESEEFSVDASVAPRRVLGRPAENQAADLGGGRWSSPRPGGLGPAAGDAASVPAQQGVGGDDPAGSFGPGGATAMATECVGLQPCAHRGRPNTWRSLRGRRAAVGARELFDRRMELLSAGDVAGVLEQYADDAEVVRFLGAARGKQEIGAYLTGYLSARGRFDLISLDQFFGTEDAVIREATVDTANGAARIYDAMILDEDGRIRREFPGMHGYWGRT